MLSLLLLLLVCVCPVRIFYFRSRASPQCRSVPSRVAQSLASKALELHRAEEMGLVQAAWGLVRAKPGTGGHRLRAPRRAGCRGHKDLSASAVVGVVDERAQEAGSWPGWSVCVCAVDCTSQCKVPAASASNFAFIWATPLHLIHTAPFGRTVS